MESFFSRYRNPLVLLAVLLVQIIGLAVQVRRPSSAPGAPGVLLIRSWTLDLLGPPEHLVAATGNGIAGLWDNYVDLIHVRQKNRQLLQEVDRLRIEQAGLAEDARQAQRLQALLNFKEKYIYKTVAAQVIGSSGSDQSHLLILDKGSADGLQRDDAVITPDGIVGRLRSVFPHHSLLLEISDATSGAGVELVTTRLQGVLRGNAYGQPEIVDVLPDERIQPGNPVITSGGDQIFPRGLPVGTVDRIVPDPGHSPLVNILIHPAAHLNRLNEVLIITNTASQMPQQEVQDIANSELDQVQQKAADILAERLPSAIDPEAPPEELFTSIVNGFALEQPLPALHPPAPARPDQFTPGQTPPAASMTPGARNGPVRNGVEPPVKRNPSQPPLSGIITAPTPGIVVTGNPQPAANSKTGQPAKAAAKPAQKKPAAHAASREGH
uniref:Cell shape-determining protein MreC n=1 Tax=Acidobacterium capsulatum TaxID=33075 RepID=A0A7V5CTK2_9BACT